MALTRSAGGRAAGLALVIVTLVAGPAYGLSPAAKRLVDSRNNVGVAYDPSSGADFDGAGGAFSGVALQLAGVTPGAKVSADGMDFRWPDTASGEPDNVEARGQSIAIPAVRGARRLGVLAAAHGGDVTATLTLTYVDAAGQTSTKTAKIAVADWAGDAAGGVTGGRAHDVGANFYVLDSTVPVPLPVGLDAAVVPLDPARRLVSVRLPKNAGLHVFDLQVGSGSAGGEEPPPALPVAATVTALPSGNVTGFAPSTVAVIQGQALDFANLDPLNPHDVVSEKRNANYQRLFSSASIPFGKTARVAGVEKLAPGTYGFICSIHGNMQGQVIVQPAG